MNNRLSCYSYFLTFAGSISLIILGQFLYMHFSKLSIMTKCRLTSLMIQHIFFIFMIYRLIKAESSFSAIIEWLVEISGGMFIISTVANVIGYYKSHPVLRQSAYFQINLDPIDRVAAVLWNHLFTQIWVYSSTIFFLLLFIILLIKIKQWYDKRRMQRAFQQLVGSESYDPSKGDQNSCSICLNEYSSGQNISRTPCNHIFHPQCLLVWMQENITCPLCRANILI